MKGLNMTFKKQKFEVNIEPEIVQMIDTWAVMTGTDRRQIVNIALLQFFGKGTPAVSAATALENLDFSALESFIKSDAQG